MPNIENSILEKLLANDFEFKKAYGEHKTLGEQIDELNNHKFVSEEEEGKINALKRQKLLLKDLLEAIAKEHQGA